MKVKVDSVSAVEKKLSVSIPEEQVLSEIEDAYKRYAKKVQIPGFRAGKVPRSMLEQRFGSAIKAEVYEDLIRKSVREALDEQKLEAIRVYDIAEPKREKGEGFSYAASVEVRPDFEPKDYLGVKVEAPKVEVKDDQIEAVLKRLQDAQAVLKHRDGATKPVKGDFAAVTLAEIDERGNLKAAKSELKEQVFEIGAEVLQPEIEKTILGMQISESADVSVKAQNPERDLRARVTLKAIKEKILPSLDTEFAKSVGPFTDLTALRSQVTQDLKQELEQKAKSETIRKILDEILKKNPLMLPETLVHDELHQMIEGLAHRMAQMGVHKLPEDFDQEKLHQELRPEAEKHVHEQLVLEAIAKKEKIAVEDPDVVQRITAMAQAAKVPPAELRAQYEKSGRFEALRFQMVAHKTLDFLLGKANVK